MPTCLACSRHIDSLEGYILNTVDTYILYIDELGREVKQYDDSLSLKGITITLYRCPECRNLLFTNYDDAVEFLSENR